MPPKTTWKKNNSSSENIEMVGKYQLWMLKVEIGEAISGFPRIDELIHQEDLFQVGFKSSSITLSSLSFSDIY